MTVKTRKPVLLMILDGWGSAPSGLNNAISVANTPVFDNLLKSRPATEIAAHGRSVGLPDGQMGNSEVGHLNLGAGRIVKQDLVRIGDAIKDGGFQKNEAFLNAIKKINDKGGKAHIIGLCSPGGVHSSLDHLYELVDLLSQNKLKVRLHAIMDGRDTPPSSGRQYVKDIELKIAGKAKIATVVGRFYSMDRDQRWDRVEQGYGAYIESIGQNHASADDAIVAAYKENQTDEFIKPRIIVDSNNDSIGQIEDGDGVFFFNFRADRAREISAALALKDFDGFTRNVVRKLATYVCMTQYQADFGLPIAFKSGKLKNILGEVLQHNGLSQFRCAETEKYAHITFFFNGGIEKQFEREDRKLIPSPKEVATYDLKPQMSALQVADSVVDRINNNDDDFILVNFANPDMVGHTGIMNAAVEAIEVVDKQVGKICDAILSKDGALLITADHGNSEKMLDEETNEPYTAHTLNPVPVIIVDDLRKTVSLNSGGSLQDIAPTILDLMKIEKPSEMTGISLIKK